MIAPIEHQEVIIKHAKHIASLVTCEDLYEGRDFDGTSSIVCSSEIVNVGDTTYTFDLEVRFEFDMTTEGDGWNSPILHDIENIKATDYLIEKLYDEINEINYNSLIF